ncbi:MAG: polysaccharide biosynthesis tyrosine autokinase, partial [Flavobacteriales bacterium]
MNKTNQTNMIESFDFKALGARMLKFWYLFVICFVIGFILSFYNIRYSVPTYKTYSKVLLKDEFSSWGQEYFLQGMELVSARNRLSNEVGMISSYNVMRSTLNNLPDFKVFYYDIGNIKTSELYKKSPFTVLVNDSIQTPRASYYFLKIINNSEFALSLTEDGFTQDKPYRFDQPITIAELTFTIHLNELNEKYDDKLYSFYINDLNSLAKVYQNKVLIETDPPESSILKFSITGENILKEADFLNALMQEYIQTGLRENNEIASNTINFVDLQLREVSDTLHSTENKLEAFKTQVNNDKLELNSTRLIPSSNELEQKLLEVQYEYNYYKHTIDYLKDNKNINQIVIPSVINVSVQDPIFRAISQLTELYTKKNRLETEVNDSSSTYHLLLSEIQITKNILVSNLQSRLDKTKFELDQLKEQAVNIDGKLSQLPNAEANFVRIDRIFNLNNTFYNYLLQKRSEAALAQASNVPKAKVLESASDYTVAFVGPVSKSIYTFNLSIAFMLPFLFVLFQFIFNNKIFEKKDIESVTKIPIIGSIGHTSEAGNLVLINKPKSVVAESFRTIRTNINYLTKQKESFCILITSSISGEGKTFCSVNLALAYSLSGKKTLLVGADLRKPKIYNDFNLKNTFGLSNYLIGNESFETIIQPTAYENLAIVSSGPIPPNPSELIESDKMTEFLITAKKQFDVVIIDTPPIGLVTDGMILSEYSDVNLYIVRQRFTRKNHLELINDLFETKKIGHVGIVVNDLKEQRIGYG